MSTQRDSRKTMIIHILKDLAERRVSADKSEKNSAKAPAAGPATAAVAYMSCSERGTRLEACAGASGLSEAFHKSPALSAAKEQRQDFSTRPQTVICIDQKQTSTLRNKRKIKR